MRCGDRFVIHIDRLSPKFKSEYNFESNVWPSFEIFDFKKWRTNDNYMQIVKDSEDHDLQEVRGKYYMNDNF